MAILRSLGQQAVPNEAVVGFDDVQEGVSTRNGEAVAPLELPVTNLLMWQLASGTTLKVRPSGTEPKLKVYVEVVVPWARDRGDAIVAEAQARCEQLAAAMIQRMGL